MQLVYLSYRVLGRLFQSQGVEEGYRSSQRSIVSPAASLRLSPQVADKNEDNEVLVGDVVFGCNLVMGVGLMH